MKTETIASKKVAPAPWEERSRNRVLKIGGDQILERSRRIVEAAYDLVNEEGLEGLTIRAVLEKTGLSRRAFYERFAGKDDLMLAVFEQTIRLAAGHYREQVAMLADPMARMNLIVTGIVLGRRSWDDSGDGHGNRRGAAMSREHLRLAESRPDELQVALRPLITLIAEQLSNGMAVGLVRDGAPQRLAALVYNLVSTTVHTELLAQEGARPDRARRTQLAADIWEFCRRAIAAP
jgi:AcrR family transcriptional regulator